MLPRFEVVARHRPVAVVGVPFAGETYPASAGPGTARVATPHLAPYAAIELGFWEPREARTQHTALRLVGADGTVLEAAFGTGGVSLSVTVGEHTSAHRSRRHGHPDRTPQRVALALTGTHLTALTLEEDAWVARGRVDLTGIVDPRDSAWLAGLSSGWGSTSAITDWSAGGFGQLGLRDIRLVTYADGSAFREGGAVLFTATSAGPGFFDTAHTSVWQLDADGAVTHRADLFFERPDRPGSFGDHATHLVRDGERWLVATSTWADFPGAKSKRTDASVAITLAETTADVTRGQHLLSTRALPVPTAGPSVGVWDPHLVRDDGQWIVGYVSAKKFFDFHPVLATGPSLDELTLRGAATDRKATEGTTIARVGSDWRVLASDGRDNPKGIRERYPIFDLDLREVGTLRAPYLTNIPWPTLIPPESARTDDDWSLVTFDGTPAGGRLPGYGTHGDLVVMRAVQRQSRSE